MDLSASHREAQRSTFAVDDGVYFRGSTAPADADRLIFLPPLWMARPSQSELLQLGGTAQFESRRLSMDIAVLGIDLGKNSRSIVGLDCPARPFCGAVCNARLS